MKPKFDGMPKTIVDVSEVPDKKELQPDFMFSEDEKVEVVKRFISELPNDQFKRLIIGVFYENKTFKVLLNQENLTPAVVWNRYEKALKLLRIAMKRKGLNYDDF